MLNKQYQRIMKEYSDRFFEALEKDKEGKIINANHGDYDKLINEILGYAHSYVEKKDD
jgi:ribosomal protein S17E